MRRQRLLFELPKINQVYFESRLYKQGIKYIAGVDEVGRGALAGPVVAASVVLPKEIEIEGIDDSKRIAPKRREELYERIIAEAICYGVGIVGPSEIDKINILEATKKAMCLAVEALDPQPQHIFIDGNQPIKIGIPQTVIVKGDMRSVSVGAASIVAKVTRDRMMAEHEERYPGFSFSVHKGYGTRRHIEELHRFGATKIHRLTFCH